MLNYSGSIDLLSINIFQYQSWLHRKFDFSNVDEEGYIKAAINSDPSARVANSCTGNNWRVVGGD